MIDLKEQPALPKSVFGSNNSLINCVLSLSFNYLFV